MDFTFSEDQLLFRESVRDFLVNEVTPETIRASWESQDGRDPALWQQIVEMGLAGMTVPEEYSGLGMNELDFVLLAQECGYVALPENLVHTVLVAVPMLRELGGDLAARWLPAIAAGEAKVVVGLEQNMLVEGAPDRASQFECFDDFRPVYPIEIDKPLFVAVRKHFVDLR